MGPHIININLSELLRKKTKESKINKHKKNFKKFQKWTIYIFIFLPNNVLTRLFKELKKEKEKEKRMLIKKKEKKKNDY